MVRLANQKVPFPTAARWVGMSVHEGSAERGIKTWCPFGAFEHPDGGTDPAFRVYPDHGWCFAEGRYFSVVSLLAAVWELDREDAAAEALRRIGYVPADYAHLFAEGTKPPEPDTDALAAALVTWCEARYGDWKALQYEPAVAVMLSRCLGLLPLVHDEDECRTWLDGCKQAMQQVLDRSKLLSSGSPERELMGTKRGLHTLPELEGWLTFPEIAEYLGISRQRVHQLAESGVITSAHRLGKRPTYIAREAEVKLLKNRKSGSAPRSFAVAPADPDDLTVSVVGGVVVTEAQLREAIGVLEKTATGRGSFKQSLARSGNPLAQSDYMTTARTYRAAHPEAKGLSTKQLLLAAYQEQLAQVPVAV